MQNIIFNNNGITVSTSLFKTPRHTYRISDIEKIAIKRPLLWFSLPIALGCLSLLLGFRPYLYEHERWICTAVMVFLPIIGWDVVTLSVTSKAYTNDVAAIGHIKTLAAARNALDKVIFQANDQTGTVLNTNH